MKITSIKSVGRKPVYDLSINSDKYDEQQYVLANGVITHNTGIYYSANDIWIIGRQQDKVGTEIKGYHFVINIEKSRFVKEKSKIPISVSWEGGIQQWSGLLAIALEGEYVAKPKNGWYQMVDRDTGELVGKSYREAETMSADFWIPIIKETNFAEFIMNKYKIIDDDLQTNDYLEVLEGLSDDE